jgi:hypothetical protein
MGDLQMLSPLTIVSLDQGKLYGSTPTIEEMDAAIRGDLGLASSEGGQDPATAAKERRHLGWAKRLHQWLAVRPRRPQPEF